MNAQPTHRGSGAAIVLVMVIAVLLPVLYVLSIGPVVALVEATGVGREASKVFYAPVIWLHHNTPLKEPLEAYGELWGWD